MQIPTAAQCGTARWPSPEEEPISSAVGARPPGGHYREPAPAPATDQRRAGALGLTWATGLVIGSIVGTGVFAMPAVLAGAGTSSLLEFGDFAGYLTGWCYWISSWAGNAAIVSAWVFYVDALGGLWIPALVNLAGIRQVAWFRPGGPGRATGP